MSAARHIPERRSSLGRQLLTALALVIVVALAFWLIGRDREAGPVVQPTETPTGTAQPQPSETTPTGPTETTAPPTETPTTTPTGTEPATPLPTGTIPAADVSVQVLDGVRSDDGARMAALVTRLEEAGYDVVNTATSIRDYPETTAFFTEGHEPDARQLQAFIPEITVVEPKLENLSDTVDVHIVVGGNYPEG